MLGRAEPAKPSTTIVRQRSSSTGRSAEILNDRGRVQWDRVEPIHYRSTSFYQMKSILKHAGILKDTGLGGSSVKEYDPGEDLWVLRDTV
jgi:hypothetical protein